MHCLRPARAFAGRLAPLIPRSAPPPGPAAHRLASTTATAPGRCNCRPFSGGTSPTSSTEDHWLPIRRRRVVVHSSLSSTTTPLANPTTTKTPRPPPPVDYVRGWAWQQCLLERRVEARKRRRSRGDDAADPARVVPDVENDDFSNDDDEHDEDDGAAADVDRLLLFEHGHVYTLGRGADESYLTFLDGRDDDRRRLGRRERGPDAARLGYDSKLKRHLAGAAGGARRDGPVEDEIDRVSDFFSAPDNRSSSFSGSSGPVLAPNGAPVYRVERGGEVTYHGPGQLVGYPLLDLDSGVDQGGGRAGSAAASPPCDYSPYQRDLHWYLRSVEEVLIRTLSHYSILGVRDDINTGVWVGRRKVAAVGVSASRWITTHGFALNVDPDLAYFDEDVMVPCGIEGRGVTSLAEEIRGAEAGGSGAAAVPTLRDVADVLVGEFEEVFGVRTSLGRSLT